MMSLILLNEWVPLNDISHPAWKSGGSCSCQTEEEAEALQERAVFPESRPQQSQQPGGPQGSRATSLETGLAAALGGLLADLGASWPDGDSGRVLLLDPEGSLGSLAPACVQHPPRPQAKRGDLRRGILRPTGWLTHHRHVGLTRLLSIMTLHFQYVSPGWFVWVFKIVYQVSTCLSVLKKKK